MQATVKNLLYNQDLRTIYFTGHKRIIGKKLVNLPLQTSSLGVQEELEFDASDYQEILPVLRMLRHRVIDGLSSKLPPQVLVTTLKETNEKKCT